jgi:hypothetical protein
MPPSNIPVAGTPHENEHQRVPLKYTNQTLSSFPITLHKVLKGIGADVRIGNSVFSGKQVHLLLDSG